ncbi:hypothetical protein ACICHK_43600 (plasmid) [Streptomyces sp. AHU1]|uniref:hypothetical protein n=1 Tax=Streptomyces sp. AHU1 TaxID=3377215 RepID=UPI003877AE0E
MVVTPLPEPADAPLGSGPAAGTHLIHECRRQPQGEGLGEGSPADLVPRSAVAYYPPNSAVMNRRDFEAITTCGEQLMRTVLPMYLR